MPEGLKRVSFHDQYLQVEQCMHSPICRLGVRAGTGNSVVLRGLSIAGKRENSNDRVTTNGPNFFVQHPLTEIQRKTDRNLWLVLIQGQSKSIHGHPDLVNPAVVECKMWPGAPFVQVDLIDLNLTFCCRTIFHADVQITKWRCIQTLKWDSATFAKQDDYRTMAHWILWCVYFFTFCNKTIDMLIFGMLKHSVTVVRVEKSQKVWHYL